MIIFIEKNDYYFFWEIVKLKKIFVKYFDYTMYFKLLFVFCIGETYDDIDGALIDFAVVV